MTKGFLIPPLASLLIACGSSETPVAFTKLGPDPLPDESFENPPSEPLQPDSLVIRPENMASFYDHPGEAGLVAIGEEYGFDSLSFIITETHPGGGPPLHTHSTEEAHVVLSGTMDYLIGEQRFTVSAPYIARVPANAPHTFVNSGATPLNLIGVLPTSNANYEPVGPNPLIAQSNGSRARLAHRETANLRICDPAPSGHRAGSCDSGSTGSPSSRISK